MFLPDFDFSGTPILTLILQFSQIEVPIRLVLRKINAKLCVE